MNRRPLDIDHRHATPAPVGPDAGAEDQAPVQGEIMQRRVVIINAEGFHLRPMAAFAETALRFKSQVTVIKNSIRADGKSPLLLMKLAALQGDQLVLEASGADAAAALDALTQLLVTLVVASEVPSSP